MKTADMAEYTRWYLLYPWHFTGPQAGQYPTKDGSCACECVWCLRQGQHQHPAIERSTRWPRP